MCIVFAFFKSALAVAAFILAFVVALAAFIIAFIVAVNAVATEIGSATL